MKLALAAVVAVASLWSAPSAADSKCQQMTIIVRNQVWEIRGLNAFCAEFEKLKSDVELLNRRLAESRRENDMLRAALDARAAPPARGAPGNR